jgi:hypothetical protein
MLDARLRNLHDRLFDEWGTNVGNFELVCVGQRIP